MNAIVLSVVVRSKPYLKKEEELGGDPCFHL